MTLIAIYDFDLGGEPRQVQPPFQAKSVEIDNNSPREAIVIDDAGRAYTCQPFSVRSTPVRPSTRFLLRLDKSAFSPLDPGRRYSVTALFRDEIRSAIYGLPGNAERTDVVEVTNNSLVQQYTPDFQAKSIMLIHTGTAGYIAVTDDSSVSNFSIIAVPGDIMSLPNSPNIKTFRITTSADFQGPAQVIFSDQVHAQSREKVSPSITYRTQSIDMSASGVMLPAVQDKFLKVYSAILTATANGTMQLRNNSATGNPITGVMPIAQNGVISAQVNPPAYLWTTDKGASLYAVLATLGIKGVIAYFEDDFGVPGGGGGGGGGGGSTPRTYGPRAPTVAVNDASIGQIDWNNPFNVFLSDDQYAFANNVGPQGATRYLKATGFGFNIPATDTIVGIKMEAEVSGGVSGVVYVVDNSVRIVKGGTISGEDKAVGPGWPNSDTWKAWGGSTDLWGLTWTPADINSSSFGIVISAKSVQPGSGIALTARIDAIRCTVYTLG
jgi:hypothetical protein